MKRFLIICLALVMVIALASCDVLFGKTDSDAEFTVTFDVNGGVGTVEPKTVKSGELISEPTAPTKEGFVFGGWYLGEEKWDFGKNTVSDNITLVAKWGDIPHEHSFSAPTCTESGKCECGEIGLPAAGHDYKAAVTVPTCTAGGYTTYTCSVCSDSYVADETNATGHTPGADADCLNNQTCTVCGDVITEALGHIPTQGTICTEATVCGRCGIPLEVLDHSFRDATCTTPKTCTVCGYTEGDALGHSYVTDVIAPTCTEGGYTLHTCSTCGDSYKTEETDATGHVEYENGLCKACGAKHPDWVRVTYKNIKEGENDKNVSLYNPEEGYPTLYAIERSGYVFQGWYTDDTYSSEYKIDSLEGVNEDITLFALWKKASSGNGGTGGGTTTPEVPFG